MSKKPQIRVFVQGNIALRDSLFCARDSGVVVWNGINEVLRPRGRVARVKHATYSRSDIIQQGPRDVPPELAECPLELGAHPLAAQFSSPVFKCKDGVVVLSMQPDATNLALQHKETGVRFFPGFDWHQWTPEAKDWVRASFAPAPPQDPALVGESMERLVERLYEQGVELVVVSTVSPWSPGETVSCYQGIDSTVAERAHSINLQVYALSRRTGCAVLDISRLVIEHGASNMQLDTAHFLPAGSRAIAEEFASILEQEGFL